MVRERGEKGKHGETDREIVFTILHNQLKNPQGLTKKQIAVIMEKATNKDREGIRRRIANMIGDQSPLKGLIQIEPDNVHNKKYFKIRLKNLKDTARFYNFMLEFMKSKEDTLERQEIHNFVQEHYLAYEDQVIDYLYLWDPFYGRYAIPIEKRYQFKETKAIDFYPEQSKKEGSQYLKRIARLFNVFYFLTAEIADHEELFFNLIGNFESFRENISQESDAGPISFNDEDLPREKDRMDIEFIDLATRILPEHRGEKIVDDLIWFLEAWRSAWARAYFEHGFFESDDIITNPSKNLSERFHSWLDDQENWKKSHLKLTKKEKAELERREVKRLSDILGVPMEEIKAQDITATHGHATIRVPESLRPYYTYYTIYFPMKYREDGNYYEFRQPLIEGIIDHVGFATKEESLALKSKKISAKQLLDRWTWKEE